LFIRRGEGARIEDEDGNRYLDWMMAYGALPLGHAHPAVVGAIREAATSGALFAAATEVEVEVAEILQKIIPGAERVRFASTGTEAVMAAVRLARGFTGRPKILKFEGHYHGWYDDVMVNAHPHPPASLGHRNDPIRIADSSGLNRRALEDTIVAPWNDLAAAERELTRSVELLDNDPFQLVLLGMTFEKKGDQAKARELFEKAFEMSTGSNPPNVHSRAFTRRKLGK